METKQVSTVRVDDIVRVYNQDLRVQSSIVLHHLGSNQFQSSQLMIGDRAVLYSGSCTVVSESENPRERKMEKIGGFERGGRLLAAKAPHVIKIGIVDQWPIIIEGIMH